MDPKCKSLSECVQIQKVSHYLRRFFIFWLMHFGENYFFLLVESALSTFKAFSFTVSEISVNVCNSFMATFEMCNGADW